MTAWTDNPYHVATPDKGVVSVERRLRATITVLVVALVTVLGVGGVLVYRYKQQNAALTTCYAVADASVLYILGAQSEHEGFMDTAAAQRRLADKSLSLIGEDDIVEAMEGCDAAFWVD